MKYRVSFKLERVLDNGIFEEIACGNSLHYDSIDEAVAEARAHLEDEVGGWPSQAKRIAASIMKPDGVFIVR